MPFVAVSCLLPLYGGVLLAGGAGRVLLEGGSGGVLLEGGGGGVLFEGGMVLLFC